MVEPAAAPPESARTDFDIITAVSHERIGRDGLQWPVAPDGTATPILYQDRFETESGLGHFSALPYKPPKDAADEKFPLTLVTGRSLEHYNAGTMRRRTEDLTLMPEDTLEINPADAETIGVVGGTKVRVRSRVGEIQLRVDVTDRIEKGHVFTAFHFPEVRTNLLTGQSADVNTSCPESVSRIE